MTNSINSRRWISIQRSHHVAYQLNYHLLILPKYRKKGPSFPISDYLLELIYKNCSDYEYTLLSHEIRPDHVHLFISALPKYSPSQIVRTLKSITARELFKKYPKILAQYYWGGKFWSNGYYVGTTGALSSETIKKYIERLDHQ